MSIVIGAGFAVAQDMSMMPSADMGSYDAGGPPVTSMGEGSYFSQDLGTMVRARFNTRSYGQDERQDGNLDIGTMQVVSWDDSIVFFDGQVTLSDVQGVGFNVGIGYRWLSYVPYATDAERVTGVSLWGDGTSTEADNFFPQLGVSFESLGDIWDLRANGYIPIGQDNQVGDFVPTGVIDFQDHFLSEIALATVDQSFYAGEIELARRLGRERDAWGFAGSYVLANDIEDTTGVRAGVRGYAYPDLLLQLAVTHDDIFETNTTFSLTWFIGRTRTNFHPACGVLDRFREPVMRNDYVALSQSTARGGTPLTDPDGRVIRFVHVDSNAPPGGDGTFERPLNNLNDIETNSQVRDIVFVHAESEFTGQSATLLSEQRFLGEGDGIEHLVVTQEEGGVPIPESSPGASDAPRPIIMAALGDAVTIGDLNEVANFTIDGSTGGGIVAGPSGSGNPNLHDLTIRNTTGDGIMLRPFVRVDTNDEDNDGNVTESTVAFNVTISDVTFDNIGGDDIDLDAFTNADVDDPNVTLQETIALTDIDSTNGNSHGVLLQNTHEDGTFTLTNYTNSDGTTGPTDGRLQFTDIAGDITVTTADITGGTGYALGFLVVDDTSTVTVTGLDYNGMAAAAGAIRFDAFNGMFTASTSTLEGGTLNGIRILNQSDGTFTFQDSVTMTNLGNIAGGIAFEIDGDEDGSLKQFTGVVTVANDITNDLGRSVVIRDITGAGTSATFNGDITDTGQGIAIEDNTGGTILFTGMLDLDTETNTAILLTNNAGADINFGGELDITTTSGNGFQATNGGTLTVSNTGNSITTETGQIAQITGMTISNAGVNFGEVNRTAGAATNAVQLENNTGGPILIGTVGDDVGESGEIAGGTADAILVRNSANVTISGVRINNVNAVSGIQVDKTNNNAMIVNINDVETNAGDIGLEVNGNGTSGNLNMTVNDTTVNDATQIGVLFNNVDNGTIDVNNALVDGGGAQAGIRILNSNATFDFDAATRIQNVAGTDFDVNGGMPVITMAGDITNTGGLSVEVQNVTGGSVNFNASSSITDTGGGMQVHDNTGGTFSFLGTNDFDPLDNVDAVVLTNNTGATMTFASLNIDTTNAGGTSTGRGLVATGGGTLSLTGLTNIIETDNGTGLQLENMTIGSVDLQRVTVDGTTGPTSAIIMRNLTGGQVAIGSATGAPNSGGILESTGDTIVLENVQNVDLRQMQISTSGAGSAVNIDHTAAATTAMDVTIDGLNLNSTTGIGIEVDGTNDTSAFNLRLRNGVYMNNVDMNITGASAFGLLVDNVDINVAATADTAFALNFAGNAQNGDVTFRNTVGSNTNDFTAGTGSALSITTSGATAKTIDLLVEEGSFSNNNAANPAANFVSNGNTLLNATIEANTFSNADGAGRDFYMLGTGAQARVRLKLGDADPANFNNAASNGEFVLEELLGADFDVFEKVQTFPPNNARNTGVVLPLPNDAAFDDSPVAPPLPTVP